MGGLKNNMEQKKKRHIPWFWRRKTSCFECGYIFNMEDPKTYEHDRYFNCPRCGYRHEWEEFWEVNHDKYSQKMVEFD
jgi:rubredoxin